MSNFIYEGIHGPEFLLSEAAGYRSREAVNVESDVDVSVEAGALLSATAGSNTIATSAGAANVGNGTFAAADSGDGALQEGRYTASCVTAAANGGTFEVYDPEGALLGEVAVDGAPHDLGGITVTLTDGTADFAVGDVFYADVSDVVGNYVIADAAGLGSVVGVLYANVDLMATDDSEVTAIMRDAEVDVEKLQWPAGATQAQKDAAVTALKNLGIISRS